MSSGGRGGAVGWWSSSAGASLDAAAARRCSSALLFARSDALTKKRRTQYRKTSYAQKAQIRQIRKKMVDIMTAEASQCSLNQLVQKLIPETIGKEIEKAVKGIYPLHNVMIRKVKTVKAPKVDIGKLLEQHTGKDVGKKVTRAEKKEEEPKA